jgi:hypothetical protein
MMIRTAGERAWRGEFSSPREEKKKEKMKE